MEFEAGTKVTSTWKVSAALLLSWMVCVLFAIGLLWSTNNIRQDVRERLDLLEVRERQLERQMLHLQRKCRAAQDSKGMGAERTVRNTISGWKQDQEQPRDQHQFTDKARVYPDAPDRSASPQLYSDGSLDLPKDDTRTGERPPLRKIAVLLKREGQVRDRMEKAGRSRRNNDAGTGKSQSSISDTKAERITRTARDSTGENKRGKTETSSAGTSTEVSVEDTRERTVGSVDQNSQKIPEERSQRTRVVWVTEDNPIAREIIKKYPIKPYYPTPIEEAKKKGFLRRREDGLEDDEDLQEGSGCQTCGDIKNYIENMVRQISSQAIKETQRHSSKGQIQLKCRDATTEWNTTYSIGVSQFLASHDLACDQNELLQSLRLKGNTDEFFPLYRYEYRCCALAEGAQN